MAEPFGLRPIRYNRPPREYLVASAAARIFKYDIVEMAASGFAQRSSTSATSTGPFLGVSLHDTGAAAPAGGLRLTVIDDPDAEYEIVGTAAIAQAALGLNYNVNVQAGDSDTGLSQSKLGAALAATATGGVKVYDIVRETGNTIATAGQKLACKISNHYYDSGTQGI